MALTQIKASNITDGTVVAAEIASNAVTTAKINADAVDGTKIADNAINSEHYTDGSIDLAHLAADSVDGTKIANDAINSEHYTDASIDNAHLADDAVGVAELSATGTASATTFLRGDNAWAAAGGGKILQVVYDADTNVVSGTTNIPDDNSFPQITEGNEFLAVAITPASASNKLLILVVLCGDAVSEKVITAALFQDSTAPALAGAQSTRDGASNTQHQVLFNHRMTAGTTSATTFRVRAGGASGTFWLNGHSGGRKLGGANMSSLTVMEIAV